MRNSESEFVQTLCVVGCIQMDVGMSSHLVGGSIYTDSDNNRWGHLQLRSRTNWSNMCASGTIHRKGRCQYDTEIGGTSTGEEEEKSDRVNHKTTTSVRPLRIYKSQTDRRRPLTSLLYSGIIQSLSLWYEHTTWPKVNWAEHRDNGSGMCRAFMSKYGAASEQVSVFN